MFRTLLAAMFLTVSSAALAAQDAPVSPDAAKSSVPLAKVTPAKPFVYFPKETDVVLGKESAPVTIVEYASLSCPHCSHFYIHALPELATKYIDTGKARMVYRNFPLNDPALKAAELVECAEPDRREDFIKVLFKTQLKWAYEVSTYRDALGNIAVLGGMDRLKFESCMSDQEIQKKVLDVAKEASDDFKVNSTPTFYINGAEYKGDHEAASIAKVIDQALAKTAKK